jgi:pyruvate formate lyase activating enzyme
MTGYVSNIQKFSVNDGYGIRTIVFLLGCTLRCKWCQNPETLNTVPRLMFSASLCKGCEMCRDACLIGGPFFGTWSAKTEADDDAAEDAKECRCCFECAAVCPYGALKASGEAMTVEQVYEEVAKDIVFYRKSGGGLTVSGGEPLVQIDFTEELLRRAKADGIGACVETAGNVPWRSFERILPFTDLFLYDVKFADSLLHKQWTGADNGLILSNLRALAESGREIIARVPLIPGLNDGKEFERIVEIVLDIGALKELHILAFHQLGSSKYAQLAMRYDMADRSEENDAEIEVCRRYAEGRGLKVSVGGSGF